MAFSVIQSNSFERSYRQKIEHLVQEAHSPQAATHLYNELQRIADVLEVAPYIRRVSSKPFLAKRNLREFYFMNYAVVYAIDGDSVILLNLFHQSQDYGDPRYWEEQGEIN